MNRLATLPDRIALACEALAARRIDRAAFLAQCTRLVADDIGCARAGVWQFVQNPDFRVLRCLAMYDAENDAMVPVPDSHDVGAYFLALATTGFVNACDAGSHFATAGPFAHRLLTRRIQSLLAASLVVHSDPHRGETPGGASDRREMPGGVLPGGELHGALTCTEVERQTEWSQLQVSTLRRVAGQVALALFVGQPAVEAPLAPHS